MRTLINRLKERFSMSPSWRMRDVGNFAPLTHATEKDGRLYDPLYDMYVDEFEDDTEGQRNG